ncbi:unnamed protein product [Rhodiola kirilowii]
MIPLLLLKENFNQLCLLLHKCMKQKALRPGKQLHAALLTSGTDTNDNVSCKLVGLYASCSDLESAKLIFNQTLNPNVFALNWMVSASAFHGLYADAIGYFQLMREMKMSPNQYTLYSVLKACVGLMDVRKGREVHAAVHRLGSDEEIRLSNVLIDMYCKCENLQYAGKVFDKMSKRDVISWTCMISGYANAKSMEKAVSLFNRMKMEEGLEPNDFTWNAMIAGFAQNGDWENATMLFRQMGMEGLVPDFVTWNAVISGLAQNSQYDLAFEYFRDMLLSGVRLNQITITGLLPACGNTGSAERGQEIHCLVYRMGMETSVFIGSALIDMYSKCGKVGAALNVFNQVRVKNVACWNAMIGCYGKHCMMDSCIQLFERMQEEGAQANEITFTCVLSACSYSGLVEKGLEIFSSMEMSHGVKPIKEHYACAIDLLCRSGRLAEAFEFLKDLPVAATDSVCGAFFNGCKIHGRQDLAEKMAQNILQTDLKKPSGYVTLSNIYAADGMWHKVENVRNEMKHKGMRKNPGFSSVHNPCTKSYP